MPSALSTMFFFTPFLLIPFTNAIQITSPAEDKAIAAGSSAEVIWNKTPRDASHMSLYLANYVNWPPSIVPLAHDVSTSATEWTVQIPCNTPASYGYQIVAVEDGNVYEVYAVGDRFQVSEHQGEGACWDWTPASTLQTGCPEPPTTTAPCECPETTKTVTETPAKPTLAERAVEAGDDDDVEALDHTGSSSSPPMGHPGYGHPDWDHDDDDWNHDDDDHHHDDEDSDDEGDDHEDEHDDKDKKKKDKKKDKKKKMDDKKKDKKKKKDDKKDKKKDKKGDKKDKKDKKKDKKGDKDKKKEDKKHKKDKKKHGKEEHGDEGEHHDDDRQSWLAGW